MKKSLFNLALFTIAINLILTGCQSVTSKENTAGMNALQAESDMNALMKANADILVADRNIFQNMTEVKIKRNDLDLADLKEKMKLNQSDDHSGYAAKIELLEQKNKELKIRKAACEQSLNNWDLFKQEYNADLDTLRSTLKDLAQSHGQ